MSHIAQKRPFASLVQEEELEPVQEEALSPPQFMSPAEKRFCLQTLKSLFKHKRSVAFHNPVDPVAFNIPDYFDVIKHPMDLSTAEQKLKNDQYPNLDAFTNDIQLIFDNCYLYNNPGDPVCQDAKKLEEAFRKLLKKAPNFSAPPTTSLPHTVIDHTLKTNLSDPQLQQPSQQQQEYISPLTVKIPVLPTPPPATHVQPMPEDEYKRCRMVIKELKSSRHKDYNWPFLQPVEPNSWGASDYYDIIKHPMDMATYEKKFNNFEYAHEDELTRDIKLMFQNCYIYNPPGHQIREMGQKLEQVFEKYWEKIHQDKSSVEKKSSTVKRKRTSNTDDVYIPSVTIPSQPSYSVPVSAPQPKAPIMSPVVTEQLNGSATHMNNGHVTVNHTPTKNDEPAPVRSNILRLKLNVGKKEEDPAKPKLALSKEPPTSANPVLAIGEKTTSPPTKKAEVPNVLKNQDKWLALATNKKLSQPPPPPQQQQQTQNYNTNIKKPTLHLPAFIKKEAPRISPPPPPPKPAAPIGFDITQITSQIYNGKKVREQEERAKKEKFEREEKTRLEKERIANEEKLRRLREFNVHANALREKDRKERMIELSKNTTDISKQKMMFHEFERKLRKDNDYVHLHQWQRDTVNYRIIPAPGFVKRAHIKLDELRGKLLTDVLRFKNSKSVAPKENEMDTHGSSDMDVD